MREQCRASGGGIDPQRLRNLHGAWPHSLPKADDHHGCRSADCKGTEADLARKSYMFAFRLLSQLQML